MSLARVVSAAVVAACVASACRGTESNDVRGRGLMVAELPAATRARVYEAAARGAFDVDNTSLLLDPRILPRTVGLTAAGRVSDEVIAEMRRRNTIKGICEPALAGVRGAPRCSAALPGYVLRFSPVFELRRDSVQVYVYSQKYDTPASGISQALRFERAYQVVRHGDDWSAAREGNVSKEVRGERP